MGRFGNLACGLVVAMAAAAGCREEAEPAPSPPAKEPPATNPHAPPVTGANVFVTACANCHGKDGKGEAVRERFPSMPDLTTPDAQAKLSSASVRQVIRDGHANMPEFDSQLSDAEIDRLVPYVRRLAAPAGD